jgi:eukaryotic-like serine/threonine-protein kinase
MDRTAHTRVFISYSHDSPEHRQRVRRLADRLIRDGVDCEIDLDEPNPPEGWWAWMDRKLAEADFVLVVCTEGYYQKATARRQPSGHGAKFESVLLVQALYDSGMWNERFIPVLFEDLPSSRILVPLRPYSRYRLDGDADYTDLLRYITHQPKRIRPPLGRVPALPPEETGDGEARVPAATAKLRFGPYEVLAPLDMGGLGEVYRGRDTRGGREVAIRLLSGALDPGSEQLQRFEQEARTAGTLDHPNLLVVYDTGSHEGRPYLICELLEGETLGRRLAGGPLPPPIAIDYATQIARGLAAAHAHGVVHRDLEPESLFITRGGRVKILDFGLARLTGPLPAEPQQATVLMATMPGPGSGTPSYMSPEQVRGEVGDQRSDLFSLGVILCEMLAGRRAFADGSPADVMTANLREELPATGALSDEVPAALQRIVRHCLEKDPDDRVHSAHDLAFDLEALGGPSAASAARLARRWPPSPRRRMLLGLAVGLAVAGILAGFLGGRAGRTANPTPTFQRITCRRGQLDAARFTPDGNIVYSAAWDGQPRAVFRQTAGAPDSLALSLPSASLLAVSRTGELAVALDCRANHTGTCAGTMATVAMSGAAPREIREQVQQADWAADGQSLALVHDDGSRARLEFPAGKVLYETDGHISFPRVSPLGDRIAFFDHPGRDVDDGSVAVVNLAGKKTTLLADAGAVQGLAWAPSGQEVWFTAARSGPDRALYAVSLSGKDRSIATTPGSLTLQDIAADGRVLLATDTPRVSIHALPPGETRERELSWLDWSVLGDLSDDGSTILFDEEGQLIDRPNFEICLRKTDGSPLLRLGKGLADALSPDGKWVLSMRPEKGAPYVLLPTHAGTPREISSYGLQLVTFRHAAWFPDGRRIAFVAAAPGHAARVWVQDLAGTEPTPVTPEGFGFWHVRPISPDGRYLFASSPDLGTMIFPVAGGAARAVPGIAPPRTAAIRWSADGRHLFVRNAEIPIRISLLDLETGRKTPWKDIAPADLAGAAPPFAVWLSADGKSYAYNLQRNLSELYLAEGLR